jgi:CheY-like chemotaxis protein/serine phosphatase RsbU (regulator of sigma subunit)
MLRISAKLILSFLFSIFAIYAYSQQDITIAGLESLCNKYTQEGNLLELSKCQTKLGFLYRDNNNIPLSIEWLKKAIQSNEALGNQNGVKNISTNIGLMLNETNEFSQAITYFKKSLHINEKLNKPQDIVSDLINIAMAQQGSNSYNESNVTLDRASSLAQETNNMVSLKIVYGMLSENFDKLGNQDKAREYFNLASSIKSQIQKQEIKEYENRTKQAEATISEKEVEIKFSKEEIRTSKEEIKKISTEKELTLQLLEQQKELGLLKDNEFKAKQRNTYLILGSLVLILTLVSFFMFLIFKQLKEKKRANALLEESNRQIAEQKAEIEVQRDIANQHRKKITDSITYAQRIQKAVLSPINALEKAFPEHFILFKPRDIVSGDFYWISAKEGVVIIAAADCTGHGVPGGFMSMLGIAFLNDIVNKITFNRHILALHANEILNQLRENVITSLHQTGKPDEAKDGMDIALCIIDFEHKQMQFAGAHNSAYIIRNGELHIIEANRMPIGIYKTSNESFTNHEVPLQLGDQIYVFSDGYYDQIGGQKNMKMMSTKFREYLREIYRQPMVNQKELLEEFYNNWKGENEQVDDVLVMGFKFDQQIIPTTVNKEYVWDNIQILIAEDVDINFYLLVEALKHTKANVHRAFNGLDAVKYCKERKIDLILMDIRMPEMDGIEATKEIRKFNTEIPIIAQTAHGEDTDIENIEAAGCNDYISKPINLKSFLATIKKHLNK